MTVPPEPGVPDPRQVPPPGAQVSPPPQAQPGYGHVPYGYGPPGSPFAYGAGPQAPWGYDPRSGLPFSDKQKLVVGLLQILVPLGIGRIYAGHVGLGVGQLVLTILTCGIGAIWPFIDGIVTLTGDPRDGNGLPLRP
ncbi:TM2 domain-containing protein [Aeromicrobium sp. CF3.5]|uniref:TM2 domain-containing protein n=1 Tax=Aeromicrobium sp. CF3.5 TaxID=3373078 RepID=UPI003EE7B9EE